MSATVRLDQTIKFTVGWKDQLGNPAPAPASVSASVSDAAKATVVDNGDGSFTVQPRSMGTVTVNVASSSALAQDTLNITQRLQAVTGTLSWDAPNPT